MKEGTKFLLQDAQEWCEKEDKSTEFMLQFMQDQAGVNLDYVLKYITRYGGFEDDKGGVAGWLASQ